MPSALKSAAILAVIAPFALSACGSASPEDARAASIERCERQFGRMAPDPSLGNALCTCMVDNLAEEGLDIRDALMGDRDRVEAITRSCATEVGIPLPA